MSIDWGPLVVAAVVSAAATVGVVSLLAFALVGYSARIRSPARDPNDGAPRPAVGAAIAAVCTLALALIVAYGLFLVAT